MEFSDFSPDASQETASQSSQRTPKSHHGNNGVLPPLKSAGQLASSRLPPEKGDTVIPGTLREESSHTSTEQPSQGCSSIPLPADLGPDLKSTEIAFASEKSHVTASATSDSAPELADLVAEQVSARMEAFIKDVVIEPFFRDQRAALATSVVELLKTAMDAGEILDWGRNRKSVGGLHGRAGSKGKPKYDSCGEDFNKTDGTTSSDSLFVREPPSPVSSTKGNPGPSEPPAQVVSPPAGRRFSVTSVPMQGPEFASQMEKKIGGGSTVAGLEAGIADKLLEDLQASALPVARKGSLKKVSDWGERTSIPSGVTSLLVVPSVSFPGPVVGKTSDNDDDADDDNDDDSEDEPHTPPPMGHMSSMAALAPRNSASSANSALHSSNSGLWGAADSTTSTRMSFRTNGSCVRMDSEALRNIRTEELVQVDFSSNSHQTASLLYDGLDVAMVLLKICGILPWPSFFPEAAIWKRKSSWYQWLILAIGLLCALCSVIALMQKQGEESRKTLCYSQECQALGLLSDIPLAWGSLLGLASLATYYNSIDLERCCAMLHIYACREEFEERWVLSMKKDVVVLLLVWLVAVFERVRGSGMAQAALDGNLDAWATLHVSLFAASSLILVALACCMLYVSRALMSAVDAFCLFIVSGDTLQEAVPRWNLVQATLRKGSASIQACLVVMQATVLFSFLLGALDVSRSTQQGSVVTLIPCVLLTLAISSVFFKAAAVTDKCSRVPSLINSCNFGEDIDEERQYVVNYVLHSAAGFHVFDLQLTSDMTLKFAYLCVVGIFALFTQVLSESF